MVWAARYRAWGNVLEVVQQDSPEVVPPDEIGEAQPVRFQGQYHDNESGLHYNRFRYYDPDIGRFVSIDPVGFFGGSNTYAYSSNPISWVDALGLSPCKPNRAEGNGSRTFAAKDPGVPELIDAIEAKFPGKVRNAEIEVYRPDGTPYTDFDVVTDTHVIQVKVGSGKGIVKQIQTTQSLTDLEVVGFDAGLLLGKREAFKGAVMKNAQQENIFITNDIEALLRKIGPAQTKGGG